MIPSRFKHYFNASIQLFALSLMLETALLSGLFTIPVFYYHSIHMLEMTLLVSIQVILYFQSRKEGSSIRYNALIIFALISCLMGDYINSGLSNVVLLSEKLVYALFLFGAGYSCYVYVLYQESSRLLPSETSPLFLRKRLYLIAPILMVNAILWLFFVDHQLTQFTFLRVGAFTFNLTIYVLMSFYAINYFYLTRFSVISVLLMMAALFIPFSDLMLFGTWFVDGQNPIPVPLKAYEINWIIYYSGQVLFSLSPIFVLINER